MTTPTIIRFPELLDRVPFSKMHIGRLERAGQFPRRIQLGPNSVGWIESEISDWITARIAERDLNENADDGAEDEAA